MLFIRICYLTQERDKNLFIRMYFGKLKVKKGKSTLPTHVWMNNPK